MDVPFGLCQNSYWSNDHRNSGVSPPKMVIFHNFFVNIYKRLFDASWNLWGNLGDPTRGQLQCVATVKPLWSADDFLSQRCLGNMKSIGHLWLETWWNCDRWSLVQLPFPVKHIACLPQIRCWTDNDQPCKTSTMATPIARLNTRC